jgi:NAD(P)H-dependent FMN reductase
MLKLKVVIASTRPGRIGLPVGTWFFQRAAAHGNFAVELVDLKEVGLPLLDEPRHPRLRNYEHVHTKAWSAIVDAADAFVFVTPEYNFAAAPSLINALDYLYVEWNYKPAAFVSYGAATGGVRSVHMARQVVCSLKMMPMAESVSIAQVTTLIDKESGEFRPTEPVEKSVAPMLDELHKWAVALAPMRAPRA